MDNVWYTLGGLEGKVNIILEKLVELESKYNSLDQKLTKLKIRLDDMEMADMEKSFSDDNKKD